MTVPAADLFRAIDAACPECEELDPRDCECRNCTGCHRHETDCRCGLED